MDDVKKKFTVALGEKALKAVVLLSNATGMTETATMMNALGFYMWAYTEWKAGKRIASIAEAEDGDVAKFITLKFMGSNDEDSDSGKSGVSSAGPSKKLLN